MKDFIFDEYQRCINPNRIEGGNKEFWFEIQTACKDGKWYHGHQYWTRGHHFEWEVYLNTNYCNSEREAIIDEITLLAFFFDRENDNKHSNQKVPLFVFGELRDLMVKYKNPQLSLDL